MSYINTENTGHCRVNGRYNAHILNKAQMYCNAININSTEQVMNSLITLVNG
jgi:hypothetical protein